MGVEQKNGIDTKHVKKTAFSAERSEGSIPFSNNHEFENYVTGRAQTLPSEFEVIGEVNRSGVVVHDNTQIYMAMRDNRSVPVVDRDGTISYGVTHSTDQLEGTMERVRGMNEVRRSAEAVLGVLRSEGIQAAFRKYNGKFGFGREFETWLLDINGNPIGLPIAMQDECQANLWETFCEDPIVGSTDYALLHAHDVLAKSRKFPGHLLLNIGAPITSRPEQFELNKKNPYVRAVTDLLYHYRFYPTDTFTAQLAHSFAEELGYADFESMRASFDGLGGWCCAAFHGNEGLAHVQDNGSRYVDSEEAVALGDLMNSNFAVGDWMCVSNPFPFGLDVGLEIPGYGYRTPKDARMWYRHMMLTTLPSEPIMTVDELKDRRLRLLVSGNADRIDRAAYSFKGPYGQNGETVEIGSAHGKVRIRVAQGNGMSLFDKKIGRVEGTGAGSCLDIVASTSNKAHTQLLHIFSNEALANGQHPFEYQAGIFCSMTEWKDQLELNYLFNFVGPSHPKVARVIQENIEFVKYMKSQYTRTDILSLVEDVALGLERMCEFTRARTLGEWLTSMDPDVRLRGNCSDVIRNMKVDGYSNVQIAQEIHRFQINQAQMVLDAKGDIHKLFLKKNYVHGVDGRRL